MTDLIQNFIQIDGFITAEYLIRSTDMFCAVMINDYVVVLIDKSTSSPVRNVRT